MNKRQKMQVTIAVLFAVLLIIWLVSPGWGYIKILNLIANFLGMLSMILSYLAEERNKKQNNVE